MSEWLHPPENQGTRGWIGLMMMMMVNDNDSDEEDVEDAKNGW